MQLETIVRPLYQDLDGASRFDAVERVRKIARELYTPSGVADARAFELLLLFHGLGKWLEKVGNLSRVLLSGADVTEAELRRTAQSVRRLSEPQSEMERAVAAAILIDNAGARGLAERFGRARREGQTLTDVVREALAESWIPEWVPANARERLAARHRARMELCRMVMEEM